MKTEFMIRVLVILCLCLTSVSQAAGSWRDSDKYNPYLILISSAKTKKELPNKYKTAKILPLHLMLGENLLQSASEKKFIYKDIKDADDRLLYRQMLLETGADFLKRQMNMIVHWKNLEYDSSVVHVHGTEDQVLPARYIESAIFLEGGTHKMVINHPEKICEIIDNYLLELY